LEFEKVDKTAKLVTEYSRRYTVRTIFNAKIITKTMEFEKVKKWKLNRDDEGKFICWRIVNRVYIGIARSNNRWGCEKSVQLISGGNNVVVQRLLHFDAI
jgi:hypothetical protein